MTNIHIFKLLITDNLLTVVQFGSDAKIYMAHAVRIFIKNNYAHFL